MVREQIIYISDKVKIVLCARQHIITIKEGAKQSDVDRAITKCGITGDIVEVRDA